MSIQVATKNIISKSEAGFSLIELLIGMLIGLFLLVGITSSYVSSKKSSITRDQYSDLEDNGRIALEVLTRTLEHAGYTSNTGAILEDKFIAGAVTKDKCRGSQNNVVDPSIFPTNSMKDTPLGDSIGVIYLGDADVTEDCAGNVIHDKCAIGPGKVSPFMESPRIYNSFYLDDTAHKDELICAGSRTDKPEVIAEGIENMQILYGINVDDDLDHTADRYVNASNIGSLGKNVVNIQIAILVRSENEIKDSAESQTFTLLDTPVTTPIDKYLRAVFSTTINLRNTL